MTAKSKHIEALRNLHGYCSSLNCPPVTHHVIYLSAFRSLDRKPTHEELRLWVAKARLLGIEVKDWHDS